MATKNFSQMTTKKLNALYATASDEDKKAISEVLAAREQVKNSPATTEAEVTNDEDDMALTAEEEAIIAEAEKNDGVNPIYNGSKSTLEKKPKMSNEELHELAEKLKANINHRCQAVPFNTIEWVNGYIAGVIEEKRSNKVLYAIKTDDGRRIVKVHDSNLIKILDETVTPVRANSRRAKTEKAEWTPEIIAEGVNKYVENVGKLVSITKYSSSAEGLTTDTIDGRIIAIMPEKRTQRFFYRISVKDSAGITRIVHKTVDSDVLQIAAEFDDEGLVINEKYNKRREIAANKATLTPQERVICCEENVRKAEEKLRKATEELELKKNQLEDAKAELNKYLESQSASSEDAESLA